jgi:hypothetical protein
MNLKLTIGLILFALLMLLFVGAAVGALGDTAFGAVAKFTPFATQEERTEKSPWFYQVSFEDIISIEVNAGGNTERFSKNDKDAWVFERLDGIPPSHTRWGGIVLLVSGPQTRRDLTSGPSGFQADFATVRATIDDPAEYGLDDPTLVVRLGLTADRSLEFRLGDKTTDGNHHYGEVIGFDELFLIADIWGEVLARLANEPPLPKWWVYRAPETITEVNVYTGVTGQPDGPFLRLQQEEGEWFARSFDTDEENRPIDAEKWAEYLPLLGGPQEFEVEEYRVRSRDFLDWGMEFKGPEEPYEGKSIEIRFSGETERGTRFIDGVLFAFGNLTEDGRHYYATPVSDLAATPLVKIPAEWADALFELVENVPYADTPDGAGSG